MPPTDDNGWNEYRRLVISRLDGIDSHLERQDRTLAQQLEHQERRLTTLEADVLTIKVKAAMWGMLGGLLISVITTTSAAVTVLAFLRK